MSSASVIAASTMRAAILRGARDVQIEHVPRPVPTAGEALVEIRAAGICGSDLHRYLGRDPWAGAVTFPRRAGHEFAGLVSALGPGTRGIDIGQRVAIEPMQLAGCGRCGPCRAGATNICANRAAGPARKASAGLAEFDVADVRHLHPLADGIPFEQAALADVYACAVHALHRIPPAPGATAIVIGTGALGLALGQVIRRCGATTILVGRHDAILASALRMGAADRVVAGGRDGALDHLAGLTAGRGADVVFECAGGTSSETLQMAVELAMPGGTVGILGAFTGDIRVPYRLANRKEITLKFCNGYATWQGRREFPIALDLIGGGSVEAAALVTHRFPLTDVAEAFRTAADKARTRAIKVMLTPRLQ